MSGPESANLTSATDLTPTAPGRYELTLSRDWWIDGTAYGGYLAAILLRAMSRQAPEGTRPLAMTVMFGSAARHEQACVSARLVHGGSSISVVAAELEVDGCVIASANATFGRARSSESLAEHSMPAVPTPDESPPLVVRPEVGQRFPLHARFLRRRLPDMTRLPFDSGGWIRLSEEQPLDYLTAVALLDSWTASAAAKVSSKRMLTVVYYVQFLNTLPLAGHEPDDFALATFSSHHVQDGYAQDDGELWSHDGILLASARQVVLVGT